MPAGGVTYPTVMRLLKEAVAAKGQRAVSREAGITLLSVQRRSFPCGGYPDTPRRT